MKNNCMNCVSRTYKDECAIKSCFANNFAIRGHKYKKGVSIDFSEKNDCTYWKENKSKLTFK